MQTILSNADLKAYLDDSLEPGRRARIEAILESDAGIADVVEALLRERTVLSGVGSEIVSGPIPDQFQAVLDKLKRGARPAILVVEDESNIRAIAAEYLRDDGFTVLEATTATEAVKTLRSEIPVDLVFTDVRMPGGFSGFDLAAWVSGNMPSIKIVLTTGYASAAAAARDRCYDKPMLNKPYRLSQMAACIRSALA